LIEACSRPERGISAVEFVNDVNILIYGDSTEGNCQKLKTVYKRCEVWARKYETTFALYKYVLTYFTKTLKWFNIKASINLNELNVIPIVSVKVLKIQLNSKLK